MNKFHVYNDLIGFTMKRQIYLFDHDKKNKFFIFPHFLRIMDQSKLERVTLFSMVQQFIDVGNMTFLMRRRSWEIMFISKTRGELYIKIGFNIPLTSVPPLFSDKTQF